MLRTFAALTASAAAGFAFTCAVAAVPPLSPTPWFEVIATTANGESYVVGSGADCVEAWENAVLPADWRDIICIER